MGNLVQISRESADHITNLLLLLTLLEIFSLEPGDYVYERAMAEGCFRDYIQVPHDENSTELSWYVEFSKIKSWEE